VDPVAVLAELGGFASRAGLLRAGVSRHFLDQAVREGRVLRVHRGIYGPGLEQGTDALRAAVAVLAGVVSHDSAAALWGLEMIHRPRMVVTIPRNRGTKRASGVRVVRADVGETEVQNGLRVTSVLRTVLDCARALPLVEAVVLADSALRKGLICIEELRGAAQRTFGARAVRVRRVAALADPNAGSVLESVLRVLLATNGLAPEQTQYAVIDENGDVIAWVDFAYLAARLLVEADGFEFHRERADYRKDRRRANAYCRLGWRLLQFSWEDIRLDPDYVIESVRFELAKSPRRTA
jgi:hypothetical protein